eukprot:m.485355 g.485355  ORF g.485355 m.485355 type:complete len:813 (-) comp21734_c0_seq1:495-2933(-)
MADVDGPDEQPSVSVPDDVPSGVPAEEGSFDSVQLTPQDSDTVGGANDGHTEIPESNRTSTGVDVVRTDTELQNSSTAETEKEHGSSGNATFEQVGLADSNSATEDQNHSDKITEKGSPAESSEEANIDGRNREGSGRSDGDKSDSGSVDGRGSSPMSPARKKETAPSKSRFQSLRSLRDRYNAAKEAVHTVPEKHSTENTHVNVKTNPGSLDIKALTKQTEAELKAMAKAEAEEQALQLNNALIECYEIERTNMLNMLKIGIKTLIESSIGYATLGEGHRPLREFCMLIENMFKHGLKEGGGLRERFATRKGIWGVVEGFEKLNEDAAAIARDVRAIPAIKTGVGKVRAFIRIALQRKQLPDIMRNLQSQEALLAMHYEPWGFFVGEEAMVMAGLLVSANTIDCEWELNPVMLDGLPSVLDFSMYLRDGNYLKPATAQRSDGTSLEDERFNESNFLVLQNQKSILEEQKRTLQQQMVAMTTTQESLMAQIGPMSTELDELRQAKEDLTAKLTKSTTDLNQYKADYDRKLAMQGDDIETERATYEQSRKGLDAMMDMLNKQMETEQKLREEVEKELNYTRSSKDQLEEDLTASEALVKSKEETIDGLRAQLKEVKDMSMSMLGTLQDAQLKVKDLEDELVKSRGYGESLLEEQRSMGDKIRIGARKRQELESTVLELSSTLQDVDAQRAGLETNISIEREYRKNLQKDLEREKLKVKKLSEVEESLRRMTDKYQQLQLVHEDLQRLYDEQDKTLVEMGNQHALEKLKLNEIEMQARAEARVEMEKNPPKKGTQRRSKGGMFIDEGALLGRPS